MEGSAVGAAARRRLFIRSRTRARFGGRPTLDRAGRRLHRRYAGGRARRQWRTDRRPAGAHHRLSDHRGRNRLAASRRRPRRAGPSARPRPGDRLWPGAGPGARRSTRSPDWILWRRAGWRTRGGRRRRRPHPVAGRPHRRQAGIRRLLGIRARRGDLHQSRHPNWGGTALISSKGELIGIGSLQIEREREGKSEHLNMTVPIDLLGPVLDDLRKFGRVNKPVRPWLGFYSTEVEDKIVIVGIAPKGPAARAELKTGDVLLAVAGENVTTLAAFYRRVWSLGTAGVEVPLTLYREGVTFEVRVNSSDRAKFLKGPRMH